MLYNCQQSPKNYFCLHQLVLFQMIFRQFGGLCTPGLIPPRQHGQQFFSCSKERVQLNDYKSCSSSCPQVRRMIKDSFYFLVRTVSGVQPRLLQRVCIWPGKYSQHLEYHQGIGIEKNPKKQTTTTKKVYDAYSMLKSKIFRHIIQSLQKSKKSL